MNLKRSLEKYNNMLEKSNQDLIRLTKISQESLDNLKSSYWDLTEPIFNSYKSFSCIIWEKFLKILGFKDPRIFKSVTFSDIKNRMSAFQATDITESEIDDLFLVYNSRETFKQQQAAELLVDWMSFALEYKLYRSKIQEIKKVQPALIQKVQQKIERISKNSRIKENLEKNLNDLKKYLQSQKLEIESSSKSSHSKKSQSICTSESRTVLKIDDYSGIHVSTEDCFREATQIKTFQKIPPLIESELELKCCRMKYFCF